MELPPHGSRWAIRRLAWLMRFVDCRIADADYERIREAARLVGFTTSKWPKRRLREAASREPAFRCSTPYLFHPRRRRGTYWRCPSSSWPMWNGTPIKPPRWPPSAGCSQLGLAGDGGRTNRGRASSDRCCGANLHPLGRYGPFRLILTPTPCVDNFPIPSMTLAALVASVIRPPTRLFSWPVGLWAVYFLLANPSQ